MEEKKPTIFKVKFTHEFDTKDDDGNMPPAREEFFIAPHIVALVTGLNNQGYKVEGILTLKEEVTVIV